MDFWLQLIAIAVGVLLTVLTIRYVWRRPYELRIAARYLYGGRRDRLMLWCAGASVLISLGGLVQVLTSGGSSPFGVMTLVLGMIAAAVFSLLALFSVFTSVSVLGVALGVAALTIVLAVTTGFQQQFRDKVLGVNAHVIVLKSQATFAEYRDVMKTAQAVDSDVIAVQPFIFAEMLVTRGKGELSGVAVKGVHPRLVRGVLYLDQHMIEGSIDVLGNQPVIGELPPIIMGKELAPKLKGQGRRQCPRPSVRSPTLNFYPLGLRRGNGPPPPPSFGVQRAIFL